VTYTITPFNTFRCLEQIRVDVCYHNLPVIIVGVGSGLSYSELGCTHAACEEMAALRALPNMTVVCPADPWEARAALGAALEANGPVYIRLGKKGEPTLHGENDRFVLGRGIEMRPGASATILAAGTILPVALAAADLLQEQGVEAQVVSLHTVKPLDTPLLERVFADRPVVATIEEHSLIGGLGGAVAEWLADAGPQRARLLRFGTPDRFLSAVGKQAAARASAGLTAEAVSGRILEVINSGEQRRVA
jgi:transketolase